MQPLAQQIKEVLAGLAVGPFGENVHVYERVGSTNDVLKEMATQGAPEGTLVIADEQTAGRGRMGRAWVAPPQSSLLMSILFRPALLPQQVYRLVMACGLAVAEACEAEEGIPPVEVKWPNDLLIGGRKFTGILPESAFIGEQLAWVVVGIGVNVNQTFEASDALAATATSLRAVSGHEHNRAALLAHILERLSHWHRHLLDDALPDAWRGRCMTLGQRVRVGTPQGVLEGLAEAVDENGMLWLRDATGQHHRISAGEATLLV
mgnify:CR=1 FL=1